jgi:hypothetical protein
MGKTMDFVQVEHIDEVLSVALRPDPAEDMPMAANG